MLGMESGGNPQSPQQRKMFKVASEIGLTRDERLELVAYLLRRDVKSWGDLDDIQVRRVLDALEGYELIRALMDLRPNVET